MGAKNGFVACEMGLEQWTGLARKRRMCVWGGRKTVSCDTENEQSTSVGSALKKDKEEEEVISYWEGASFRVHLRKKNHISYLDKEKLM